jgi:DinB family protein
MSPSFGAIVFESMDAAITVLLAAIDEAFDHRSWHGTNLRGSLRGLSPSEAAWRPTVGRHNIWEIAVHAAYWKYTVRRRLLGEKRGSFPLSGSNWFRRPVDGEDDGAVWRADLELLTSTHQRLREAVAHLKAADLVRVPAGGKTSVLALATGIAAHDVYHAGQIQLLKRLRAQTSPAR